MRIDSPLLTLVDKVINGFDQTNQNQKILYMGLHFYVQIKHKRSAFERLSYSQIVQLTKSISIPNPNIQSDPFTKCFILSQI